MKKITIYIYDEILKKEISSVILVKDDEDMYQKVSEELEILAMELDTTKEELKNIEIKEEKIEQNFVVSQSERMEFIGQILDVFEDFLTERDIRIPTSDKEKEEDENGEEEGNYARLYGDDYSEMQEKLEDMMINWGILEKF